jgi:hypothetical protein
MRHRIFFSIAILAALIAAVSLIAAPIAGQARTSANPIKPWTPPKTPWGDPDLQGIYSGDDYMNVPLERPVEFGNRLYLTDQEIDQRAAQIERQAETDGQETAAPNARVTTGPPSHWGERPKRAPRQTSRIIDPPDGRMPALTPEGQKRREENARRQGAGTARPAESWEDFSLYIRCITRGIPGSIPPTIYGNGTQIVQAPGYVAIFHEMVHEARIIPLDGRAHVGPAVNTYMGDSRGRWEGNTLVVETTNIIPNSTGFGGTTMSDAARYVERFTKVDANTLNYEITVHDPKTYTKPFTVAVPIRHEPGYQLFEYGCHEGNHGMMNQLSGSRADERAAEAAKQNQR